MIFYQGTSSKNLPGIAQHGLHPGVGLGALDEVEARGEVWVDPEFRAWVKARTFFTAVRHYAERMAWNASQITGSEPRILELMLPPRTPIEADYSLPEECMAYCTTARIHPTWLGPADCDETIAQWRVLRPLKGEAVSLKAY